jgi:hypothetical protein
VAVAVVSIPVQQVLAVQAVVRLTAVEVEQVSVDTALQGQLEARSVVAEAVVLEIQRTVVVQVVVLEDIQKN